MSKITSETLKGAISVVNLGKVRVELRIPSTDEIIYVSPTLTAMFYSRMLKEKPFTAFIEIKKYQIEAKIVELKYESVVIEWTYRGPETFSEVDTYHPLMWEHAIDTLTASVMK